MNMSPHESEHILSESRIEPARLAALEAKLVLFAQRHDRLKIIKKDDTCETKYGVRPVEHWVAPSFYEGGRYGFLVQHKLAALATHYIGGARSLFVAETSQITELGSVYGGVKVRHGFKWSEDGVTYAKKRVSILPEQRQSLDEVFESRSLGIEDDEALLQLLVLESETLTADDVEHFIRSTQRSIEPVDEGARPYVEKRKNYFDYVSEMR